MLPWTALFCLVSANLVASQLFLPEIFGSYDPRTILKPYKNELKSGGPSDDLRVIRALLTVRQTECPVGTAECTNVPGRLALQFTFLSLSLPSGSTRVLLVVTRLLFHNERIRLGMLNIGSILHSCCPTGDSCCDSQSESTRDVLGSTDP